MTDTFEKNKKNRKEKYEWIHSWCDETDANDLPRVLLVGDSITYGYESIVREKLRGICRVDYVATSYAIDSKMYNKLVSDMIEDSDYEAIHFNHGLHGFHMTKRTYKSRLLKLLLKIKKESKIIMAFSTFVYKEGNKKSDIQWKKKVIERNSAMRELAEDYGYTIDDLYSVSERIPKEYRKEDGVHYEKEIGRAHV